MPTRNENEGNRIDSECHDRLLFTKALLFFQGPNILDFRTKPRSSSEILRKAQGILGHCVMRQHFVRMRHCKYIHPLLEITNVS
jgi:hypothetical protein